MIPTAFSKTLHALDRSRPTGALWRLGIATALLAALGYWMTRVPVTLYETSSDARVEIDTSAAAAVLAPMTGKVVWSALQLGRQVQAGEVLVRTDSLPRQSQAGEERRVIRAPVSGVIGEAMVLRPGSVIAEGARVASILPSGKLRIVAFFPPRAAYGRVQAGARAKLRLQGYPWAEFGAVEARVTEAAGEDRDGRARVELEVLPSPSLKIALRHGMPGELEIEVDRLPPMQLVLRTAGQWMTASPGR